MKLRRHGIRTKVAEVTRRLVQVLDVVAVSEPYPDRGTSVLLRVYVEVRLTSPEATGSTGAPAGGSRTPPGQRPRLAAGVVGRWGGR